MPNLGPIVNLTEDPSVDLRMTQQIGGAIGSYLGIREHEKIQKELDAELTNVLSQSASGAFGTPGSPQATAKTLEEMTRRTKGRKSELTDMYKKAAIEKQFRNQDPQQFTLGGQGGTAEERYQYNPNTGQTEKIATGPTPIAKNQRKIGYNTETGQGQWFDLSQDEMLPEGWQANDPTSTQSRQLQIERLKGKIPLEQEHSELTNQQLRLKNQVMSATTDDQVKAIQQKVQLNDARIKEIETLLPGKVAQQGATLEGTEKRNEEIGKPKAGKPDYAILRIKQGAIKNQRSTLFVEYNNSTDESIKAKILAELVKLETTEADLIKSYDVSQQPAPPPVAGQAGQGVTPPPAQPVAQEQPVVSSDIPPDTFPADKWPELNELERQQIMQIWYQGDENKKQEVLRRLNGK